MNRRNFLKTVLGTAAAVVAPVPWLDEPSTRTVIDMNPQALPLYKVIFRQEADPFAARGEIAEYHAMRMQTLRAGHLVRFEFVKDERGILRTVPASEAERIRALPPQPILEEMPRPIRVLTHLPGSEDAQASYFTQQKVDAELGRRMRMEQENVLHNLFHDLQFYEPEWMREKPLPPHANTTVQWQTNRRKTAQEDLPELFASEPGWTIDESGRLRRG